MRSMHIARFEHILDQFTSRELADALGCPYQTAAAMKRRGYVNAGHWQQLIAAAAPKGMVLDPETLVRLAGERRQSAGIAAE